MTQAAGWYDDPQDPNQLRYWDGIIWSSHISPKISPAVAQSTIGMPYGVVPAAARPQSPGSQGAQGPSAVQDGYGTPPQVQGQRGGEWPSVQGVGQQGQGWPPQQATTPDGAVLSGWWKRVLARILDLFLVSIVAMPFAYVPAQLVVKLFGDFIRQTVSDRQAGITTTAQPPPELIDAMIQVGLIVLAVRVVYEIAFLTWRGATPGKMVVGISVRLRAEPGPLPLFTALKRTTVMEVGRVLGFVQVVGGVGSLFSLLDSLWPLWDDKKQAIHDKAAATNVVVGSQPRRKA